MQDLKNLELKELKELCKKSGFSSYKAKEIFRAIHQRLIESIDDLTMLKKDERAKIKSNFILANPKPIRTQRSKGTSKTSLELADGKIVESVFMNYGDTRKTVCVSCQVGCLVKCQFCATGRMGFKRNLSTAEILAQVYHFARHEKVSNLVFMGMGEPLINYNNVLNAIKILNAELGLNIASRKIVVSTIGIVPGIKKFAKENKQLRLAWSLAAPTDEQRRKIIPYKSLSSIKSTVDALREYQEKTKRRVTIEYVVLKDINDSFEDAKKLSKICRKLDAHVNLIPFNSHTKAVFKRGQIELFHHILQKMNLNVTIRQSLGQDIDAACGQLAGNA